MNNQSMKILCLIFSIHAMTAAEKQEKIFACAGPSLKVSTALLEQAIEKTEHKWLEQFDGATCETINNLNFWHSPVKEPFLNAVKGTLTASSADISDGITTIIARLNKNAEEKTIMWFARKGKDVELDKKFAQLHVSQTPLIAMVCPLPLANISDLVPAGFVIERVKLANIFAWIKVWNNGFGSDDSEFMQLYAGVIRNDLEQKAYEHYCIQNADNEIVTIGSLAINENYAEIANIATRKNMRKKGLASAMVRTLVKRASSLNLDYAYLIATAGAKKIYEANGFSKGFDLNLYEYCSKPSAVIPAWQDAKKPSVVVGNQTTKAKLCGCTIS